MRKWLLLIFAIFVFAYLHIPATAHPGRTDSAGGHYNRATGEYHYHNGASAGKSSGSSSNDKDQYTSPIDKEQHTSSTQKSNKTVISSSSQSNANYSTNNEKTEGAEKMPTWGYWIIGILALVCLVQHGINKNHSLELMSKENNIRSLKHDKDRLENSIMQYRAEIEKLLRQGSMAKHNLQEQIAMAEAVAAEHKKANQSLREEIGTLRKELDALYRAKGIDQIEIPDDVYFVLGTIPVKGEVTRYFPFGDYTVFVSPNGTRFHADEHCGGGYRLKPAHVYDVLDRYEACGRCASCSPYLNRTIPAWYSKLKLLENTIKAEP